MFVEQYWWARFWFYRGLFLTYFFAFLVAFNQFVPLAGENGILPFTRFLDQSSFWKRPSLLHFFASDNAIRLISFGGVVGSAVGFFGFEWAGTPAIMVLCSVLWFLYLSLVKAGNLFYGYGWESFLCETGALSIFLGGAYTPVSMLMGFLFAWLLFRVMFGAGMIKIRGDECWRKLTCMDFHYETQPIPNPLSWLVHHLPRWWHKLEVLGNHFTELVVPFFYFAPQPYAGMGAGLTIGFQGWLMLTGNFSWLNFLTIVISIPLVPDSAWLLIPGSAQWVPAELYAPDWFGYMVWGYAGLVLVLSYWPARNLVSRNQLMNAGFDPFNLVNTYGAFGSITRARHELVVEGRYHGEDWMTYHFKGKPTDLSRRPTQWAPYHLRLDWQMWFAAMRSRPPGWIVPFVHKLFENDAGITGLLRDNPFEEGEPPDEIRIRRFRYWYTEPEEYRETGNWWKREFVDNYLPPVDQSTLSSQVRSGLF